MAVLFLVAFIAFPTIALAIVSSARSEEGMATGLVVVGGSFLTGLTIGLGAVLFAPRSWIIRQEGQRPLSFWTILSIAGSALLLRNLVPHDLFGWDSALVIGMLGDGLALPIFGLATFLMFRSR